MTAQFTNSYLEHRLNFTPPTKKKRALYLTRGETSEATLEERPNLDLGMGMSIFFDQYLVKKKISEYLD